MSGWIKLHRKMIDWEWYSDLNVRVLFTHCLLRANYQDVVWRNIEIKRGTFLTSISKLSDESGLTQKQVRASILKLQRTNELVVKSTTQYTVIQVVKYSEYQQDDTQEGKQKGKHRASDGQTEGKQRATNKNNKEGQEEQEHKKDNKPDSVSKDVWDSFLKHRKNKNSIVTDLVIKMFQKQADIAGITLEDAISYTIYKGWISFKAEWYLKENPSKQGASVKSNAKEII